MKKLFLLLSVCLALGTTSCYKDQYEATQKSLDSLQNEKAMVDQEVANYLSLIQEVQSNFRTIKNAELGILEETQGAEGVTPDSKQKIQQDFQTITDAIRSSRMKIDSLDQALSKAQGNAAYFRGLVSGLQRDLKENEKKMKELKTQLENKDIKIASLSSSLDSMTTKADSIFQVASQQQVAMAAQEEELNKAYYFVGDKATLKQKGLREKLLKSASINPSICTAVDIRNFTELDLNSKKAFLLTSHPLNSYKLVQKSEDDKNLILKITNYNAFWANSKFLIIQVK